MATHPNPNHHIVLAALGDRERRLIGWTALSAPLTWNEAQNLFDKLDAERRAGVQATGRRRVGHVLHYAVRGVSDPRWASLISLGYADARSKDGRKSYKGDSGRVKAAKVWAARHGYKGAGGGWIYGPDGKPYVQGWESFAHTLQRRGDIAMGSDENWYVLDLPLVEADAAGHRPAPAPDQVPYTVPDSRGNRKAREGCDRCACGCKYWENDVCIDCNTHIDDVLPAPVRECMSAGTHLTDCDDDGYCNFCGHQEGGDND